MLIAGSWEDEDLASRVSWTPVYNDPGVGNDERIPTDTDNFLDLDSFDGGAITAMSRSINGAIYIFKRSHIYKLVRTGSISAAYSTINLSKSLGALPGSVVEGSDQSGMPCLYFLDLDVGPCRTGGSRTIQIASRDILKTWRTVNKDAIVICRGLYYPESRQVHWWISTDTDDYPELSLVVQTNETIETQEGIRGGFSKTTGKRAPAYKTLLYSRKIDG